MINKVKEGQMFKGQRISFSGMRAEKIAYKTYATNIANANSLTSDRVDKDGNAIPYKPQEVVFETVTSDEWNRHRLLRNPTGGVGVRKVVQLDSIKKHYDPYHPLARLSGADIGYVYSPDIRLPEQMANLEAASLAYQANLTALSIGNKMFDLGLNLGK